MASEALAIPLNSVLLAACSAASVVPSRWRGFAALLRLDAKMVGRAQSADVATAANVFRRLVRNSESDRSGSLGFCLGVKVGERR